MPDGDTDHTAESRATAERPPGSPPEHLVLTMARYEAAVRNGEGRPPPLVSAPRGCLMIDGLISFAHLQSDAVSTPHPSLRP